MDTDLTDSPSGVVRDEPSDVMARDDAQQIAEWFAALGDPTRVQLLAWLARQPEPVAVRDIVPAFPHAQSTISHHLAALTRTCFVTCERVGTSSLYAVDPDCLQALPAAADAIMTGRTPIRCLPATEPRSGRTPR